MSNNTPEVREFERQLDELKFEDDIREKGFANITSRECGQIGGNMVGENGYLCRKGNGKAAEFRYYRLESYTKNNKRTVAVPRSFYCSWISVILYS